MKPETGKVFSIAKENRPLRGCTVSKEMEGGRNAIVVFSMDKDTDISPEIYSEHKFLLLHEGDLEVYGREEAKKREENEGRIVLSAGEAVLCKVDEPVGMRTKKGAVYTEINIRREDKMNEVIKAGEVFR